MMQRNFIIKIGSYFLLFTFVYSSVFAASQDQNAQNVIQEFIHAYENKDLKAIANLYAANATVIGTGKDEVLKGREQIVAAYKRDFAQSTKATLSVKDIAINTGKNSAIASYYLITKVEIPNSAPFQSRLRLTIGLLRENNRWVILQSHLSAPLADQEEGKSFPKA